MRIVKWLCLVLGLSVLVIVGVRYDQNWSAAQKDKIYEAVFRHEIQRLDKEISPAPEHYCLLLAEKAPGSEFMQRFQDLGSKVQREPAGADAIIALDTKFGGPTGVDVVGSPPKEGGPMHWSRHRVSWLFGAIVTAGPRYDYRNYELERKGGEWTVTRDRSVGQD